MLDKRKLIRLLLRYNYAETSFFDLKRELNVGSRPAKAKLAKHISAFSNANPRNKAFIVYGVTDKDRELEGVYFTDDADIQNIVGSYLKRCPKVRYENVTFPDLPDENFIGLLTIFPSQERCSFARDVAGYHEGDSYVREGSKSVPLQESSITSTEERDEVGEILSQAQVRLEDTIDSVIEFYRSSNESYNPNHFVFKDQYVVCFKGWDHSDELWSECYFELVNENVELFFSAVKYISIDISDESLIITEYVPLTVNHSQDYYPLENTSIQFFEDGEYNVSKQFIFDPPNLSMKTCRDLLEEYKTFVSKLRSDESTLDPKEELYKAEVFADELLMCILNGLEEARPYFEDYLYEKRDGSAAEAHMFAQRVLEKCEANGIVQTHT